MYSSKEEVIKHLRNNNIVIEDLSPSSNILGWEVKIGMYELYLEAPEYIGLVESSIYQKDID